MELLTVEEVAERLKIEPETIRRWLRAGNIKGVKINDTTWRILDEELKRFIESSQNK